MDPDTTQPETTRRGDGYAEIFVAEDGMSARAELTAPVGAGRPVTRGYIEQLLKREDIAHGIDWAAIDAAIEECNAGRRGRAEPREVTVARGTAPVAHVPSHYSLHPSFAAVRDLIDEAAANPAAALHRSRTLPVAFAGQALALLESERPGEFGTTVRGEQVAFDDTAVESLRSGKNTRLQGDRIVAAKNGLLRISRDELVVDRDLSLACDVDNATGDISFPGNLTLNGTVHDGFRLWIGGDLHAKEALDAHEVFCRGELAAAGGIIGKRRGLVRCRGKVRAKFAESCSIESKSTVYVEKFCYNAHIQSLDRLVTADHGKIIGGEVRTAHGVSAGEIGNRAGITTKIVVGSDFIVNRKLESARAKIDRLQDAIDRIDSRLDVRPADSLRNRKLRLVEKRDSYKVILETLVKSLDRNEQATVIARSAVYPGTTVEICRASYVVEKPLGPTAFRLDVASGRIMLAEPGAENEGDLDGAQ